METSRSIVIAGLDPASYPFSKKMDARGVGERKRRLSSNGYPAHDGRAKAALSLQSRRIFSFREPSCWFESVTLPRQELPPRARMLWLRSQVIILTY
jgi:hypothetical protein